MHISWFSFTNPIIQFQLACEPKGNSEQIFVATANSHVNVWPVKPLVDSEQNLLNGEDAQETGNISGEEDFVESAQPLFTKPKYTFPGLFNI